MAECLSILSHFRSFHAPFPGVLAHVQTDGCVTHESFRQAHTFETFSRRGHHGTGVCFVFLNFIHGVQQGQATRLLVERGERGSQTSRKKMHGRTRVMNPGTYSYVSTPDPACLHLQLRVKDCQRDLCAVLVQSRPIGTQCNRTNSLVASRFEKYSALFAS